jgi:hypothetical protein
MLGMRGSEAPSIEFESILGNWRTQHIAREMREPGAVARGHGHVAIEVEAGDMGLALTAQPDQGRVGAPAWKRCAKTRVDDHEQRDEIRLQEIGTAHENLSEPIAPGAIERRRFSNQREAPRPLLFSLRTAAKRGAGEAPSTFEPTLVE